MDAPIGVSILIAPGSGRAIVDGLSRYDGPLADVANVQLDGDDPVSAADAERLDPVAVGLLRLWQSPGAHGHRTGSDA